MGGVSYIDDADVGASAAAVLLNPGKYNGKELPLTAGVTNGEERVKVLGEVLGKEVKFEHIDFEAAAAQLVKSMGLPEAIAHVLLQYPTFANEGGCDKEYPELGELLKLLDAG